MSGVTVKPADLRIIDVLSDGPKSAREIGRCLHLEDLNAWSEENGYDFEWFSDEEPFGARLLAHIAAKKRGDLAPHLSHDVYPRLRFLERIGLIERIQIQGQRPMLWRIAP